MFARRTRVLQASLLAIFSAFVVELAFGLVSGSLALITDSIHALLDCIVTMVLLLAARWAARPPDADHTYGHGKIESLGGLIGGIAIFLVACFFVYESATRLYSPPPMVLPGIIAIIGGLYTIGVDVFRVVLLRRSVRRLGGATLRADLTHALADMGSTAVAIGGIVLVSYGVHFGDFAAALVLGVLLAALSAKLVYRTAMDLTDVISPELVREIRGISAATDGVVGTGPVLVRRSGDTVFADVTVSLRGDTSFERAHEISSRVEGNIRRQIPSASTTVHFEPDWKGVPPDARMAEIAAGIDGVMGVHNVATHRAGGRTFATLHVMVSGGISLLEAHKISEAVEQRIRQEMPGIAHVTAHLEPFVKIPADSDRKDAGTEGVIRSILEGYPDVRGIGRIVSLRFGDVTKIDIDCSFDGTLPIERVHDLTSEIERLIREQVRDSVITIHPEPG